MLSTSVQHTDFWRHEFFYAIYFILALWFHISSTSSIIEYHFFIGQLLVYYLFKFISFSSSTSNTLSLIFANYSSSTFLIYSAMSTLSSMFPIFSNSASSMSSIFPIFLKELYIVHVLNVHVLNVRTMINHAFRIILIAIDSIILQSANWDTTRWWPIIYFISFLLCSFVYPPYWVVAWRCVTDLFLKKISYYRCF